MSTKPSLQLSIVYDNNAYDERLQTDWGYSCFVQGLEKSILFDTGAKGQILLSNMGKLGIMPEKIDVVVLSHAHGDHSGGLEDLLDQNSRIEVFLHNSFSSEFREKIRKKASNVVEVEDSQKICEGAYTSGVINGWIKEQSLVLDAASGIVLITGCAHPRIINIIGRVKELFKIEISLAMGGFHLAGFEKKEIKEIIGRFRDLGVQKVGPCHCSGNDARMLFQEEYRNDFLEIGVGKEILIQ